MGQVGTILLQLLGQIWPGGSYTTTISKGEPLKPLGSKSLTIDDEKELTKEVVGADTYKETIFSALFEANMLLRETPTVPPAALPLRPTS